ncbi:hypothetical protein GCQ56_07915 [Marinifilum sp. N1E240]|uniref:hypothetical protein n=1 Tax=Marinifilum sp. N1E240 TaxID=2608082 RepID=UPI00128D6D3A|nr:hypothetical protein [Marinifilum sp. N1E240]MPQ46940.1 hypothetical protein [Marinifilum sp. N1E240]
MNILEKILGKKTKSELKSMGRSEKYIPDFDQLDEFGQIETIFDYTLNSDFAIANKAAQTVDRLFNSIQVIKHKQLYGTFKYFRINISDLKKFNRFDKKLEITLLCVASMNGNGFLRAMALSRLIEFQAQNTIPFILFRLADWVPQIRQIAEKALKKFLVGENNLYFIQKHKLINWLLHIERTDLSELYNQIINSVVSNPLKPGQIKELGEGDRFFYYKTFVKAGLIDKEMINKMLTDKYYLIRLLMIKHSDKIDDLQLVLVKLLKDKSQKVRQVAVNMIANQDINEYETILRILVFDNSTQVRAEARRLLSTICDCNFKKIYQESLSNNQLIIGSILGLSEVADKGELPILNQYLNSDRARIKTASLIGIYNLDNTIGTENAYQILESENPVSTRRAAESILVKQGIDFKRLRTLYDLTDSTGKKIILRLFNRFSGWSVAGDFLKALTDNDAKIQLMAKVFLESWNNYTIRLATIQSEEDKNYVLSWYETTRKMGIEVPGNIPFIFGEN